MFPSYNSKPRKEKKWKRFKLSCFFYFLFISQQPNMGSNEKLSKKPKLQTNPDNQKKKKKKKGTKIRVVLLSETLVLSG